MRLVTTVLPADGAGLVAAIPAVDRAVALPELMDAGAVLAAPLPAAAQNLFLGTPQNKMLRRRARVAGGLVTAVGAVLVAVAVHVQIHARTIVTVELGETASLFLINSCHGIGS